MAHKKLIYLKKKFSKIEGFLKEKKVIYLIRLVLISMIILNLVAVVYQERGKYFVNHYWENFPALEKVFRSSQYMNKHPKGFIPDEIALSYAGGKLIKGTNPVLVVPEAPPLGKYLVGLSTVFFDNDSTVILISGVLVLFCLYLLGFQVLSSKTLALIPPFLFSSEQMFKNQFIYTPLFDLFQLVFLIAGFYFFNRGASSKKFLIPFLLTNIFLGLFISTKFFVTGSTIVFAWFLVLFLRKDFKKLFYLFLMLPVSIFILLFSYIRVFAFGYTLSRFLGIQKWIFLYHKSQLILPFSAWPLLLLNRWYVWFGNKPVISDAQWSILWPIATIGSIIAIFLYVFKKIQKNPQVEILMAWFVGYMLFLSVGQIFSRYFVIMIPILYIILVYGLVSVYKVFKQ